MKKTLFYCGALVLALVSCQKIETPIDAPEEYTYTFEISNDEGATTKSTFGPESSCIEWETSDLVANFSYRNNMSLSYGYTQVQQGTDGKWNIAIRSSKELAAGDIIYCYYPSSSDNNNKAASEISLQIPVNQSQQDNFVARAMPMVSLPLSIQSGIAANSATPVDNIKMANLGSIIEFTIKANEEYANECIQSVTFNSDDAITGTFTFDLTNVDYSNPSTLSISGISEKTATTEVGIEMHPSISSKVYMVIAPGNHSGKVVVKTDFAEYTYTISNALSFNRSMVKPLGLTLDASHRNEITDWVSLPWSIDGKNGISTWKNTPGLAAVGCGTYNSNSPYLVKMDDNGDYVQVRFNDSAEAVSFAVKMIGGASTSSITLQGSSNGFSYSDIETFEISGVQNTELNFTSTEGIDATYRYIRLSFTKGSNVGLGPVSISKYDPALRLPTIIASNITVPAKGGSSNTTYAVKNLTDDVVVDSYSGCVTTATANNGVVSYSIAANYTGAEVLGNITLKSTSKPEITKVIEVSQTADVFTVSQLSLTAAATAGSKAKTSITSTYGFELELPEGVTANITSTSASEKTEVEFTITSANESTEDGVQYSVIVKSLASQKTGFKTITINQSAATSGSLYFADFEGENEHRTSGTNQYTTNNYTVSGTKWALEYADIVSSTKVSGNYNMTMRVAKSTTNTATAISEAISLNGKTAKKLSFKSNGNTALTVKCYVSSNGTNWTSVYSGKATSTTKNCESSVFSISGSIYVKFEVTAGSSTASNRDVLVDDIVIE